MPQNRTFWLFLKLFNKVLTKILRKSQVLQIWLRKSIRKSIPVKRKREERCICEIAFSPSQIRFFFFFSVLSGPRTFLVRRVLWRGGIDRHLIRALKGFFLVERRD